MANKFLGYTEAQIIEIYQNSKDQVDINRKLDKTTSTLTQLVQSSHKLVSENKDFLHMIYNDLEEKKFGGTVTKCQMNISGSHRKNS